MLCYSNGTDNKLLYSKLIVNMDELLNYMYYSTIGILSFLRPIPHHIMHTVCIMFINITITMALIYFDLIVLLCLYIRLYVPFIFIYARTVCSPCYNRPNCSCICLYCCNCVRMSHLIKRLLACLSLLYITQ